MTAFEGNISGIPVRVIIGRTKYNGREIETYVPQIRVGDDDWWVDVLNPGVIYKNTQVGKDGNSISVDQLDHAIQFLNIKVNTILSVRQQMKELKELKSLV